MLQAFLSILLPVEMNYFSTKICLMAIIFNADDYLYINCGGEKAPINGSIYEADTQRHGASTFYLSPNKNWGYSSMGEISSESSYIVNRTFDPSMVNMALYSTARISPLSLKYYGFCLKNGNYIVRLHFAEIVFTEEKGERVFNVKIQNETLLSNFSIKEAVGGLNKEFYKEFPAAVSDHLLEIHFYWAGKGSVSNAQQPDQTKHMYLDSVQKSGKLSGVIIAGIAGSAVFLLVLVLVIIWKMGCLRGIKLPGDEFYILLLTNSIFDGCRFEIELKYLELFPEGFFNFRQIKVATQNFSSAKKIGEGGFGPVHKGLEYLELFPEGFFNFRQIKVATQNFSSASKIGEGGFGPVYKGVLQNGAAIAVKQLSPKSKQGVRPEEFRSRLNWPTRVKICLGIAKGLAFLHEESKLKIVHRDVKPTNILLDKNLNAKISDFGFAKLYEGEKTHVITRIAGTNGYMAPEYATRGYLTNKADVYSFGVVILEVVSGKNSMKYKSNAESVYLLDLAYDLQEKGNLIALIDPILGYDYSMKEALTILELAMLCTNPSPTVRPTMSEVVRILEGKTQMKAPPLHAPYSADNFTRAKAMADIPLSIQSGGTFREGTSNPFSSLVVGKEGEECNVAVDYSPEI
ncbi:hypothetical protein HHK36_023471 [Tetracentron sinense]|uniref:non-specific serine/threonine protein kinase n=1 Tax=Tetracentron sinense TaxID=13715 RepID=A0A834YQ86_TETSI|nr:hypothetical protein HHK36_023471 [Tetracentron sinense]